MHRSLNFLRSNTFTSSAMHVLLLNFFDNVSQSLPNQEFVSILVKRWIFSKRLPYSIFILVSYRYPCISIIFKQNWECILPSHLFPLCVSVSSKSRICVNSSQKVDYPKRTLKQHFHRCFLVFFYHTPII